MITIAEIRVRPDAAIAENEMVAPSSTTANSSTCLALNAIPGPPALVRFPEAADGDPDQNRNHQRFQIGMAENALLELLQRPATPA